MSHVVILGAGVIGASVAWHLASRGIRDVVVIDRGDAIGGGSTSRATGGFRLQFSSEPNIRLSLLSREKLLRFVHDTGVDPGYAQHGYLFIARSRETFAELRAVNAIQQRCRVTDARIVDTDEIRRINPAIDDPQMIGGAWCPHDGFIKPMEILRGYYEASNRLGVRFLFGEEVTSLMYRGGRIAAAVTRRGVHEGEIFVNALGAWAGSVSDVPVRPLRRNVATTVATSVLSPSMPMTIWADDGFHLRVRDGRVLLLRPHDTTYGFDDRLEQSWIDDVTRRAHDRVPILRDVPIDRANSWSGFYEMTPDRHVILGRAAEPNLFLAVGSSGNGVMHSPAIGQLVAELVMGEPPTIDVYPLRPTRFVEGEVVSASELL